MVQETSPAGATAETTVDITRGGPIIVDFSNQLGGIVVTVGDSGGDSCSEAGIGPATVLPDAVLPDAAVAVEPVS